MALPTSVLCSGSVSWRLLPVVPNKPLPDPVYTARNWETAWEQEPGSSELAPHAGNWSGEPSLGCGLLLTSSPALTHHSPLGVPASSSLSCGASGSLGQMQRRGRGGHRSIWAITSSGPCSRHEARAGQSLWRGQSRGKAMQVPRPKDKKSWHHCCSWDRT